MDWHTGDYCHFRVDRYTDDLGYRRPVAHYTDHLIP